MIDPISETARPNVLDWLRPGACDVVFVLVLVSVLIGGRNRLLNDPGTFWHVQLGRDIARTGHVPIDDTLTFTHQHDRWVDQSWLYDLGLAWVVDHGGWSTTALATALILAALYAAIAHGLMAEGRSPLVALVVAILASGVGATHFLVRPHVLSLGFVWLTFRVCQLQHERGGWWVASTPVITAVWANIHGGFLAGPILVFTAAAGHLVSGPWDRKRLRASLAFMAAGGACLAAALVNPYGVGLYRHVVGLLFSSGVTGLIEEYQPIPFGTGDARVVEWVILGLIALPTVCSARMSRFELVHTLVWLHLALASVRHAPIFAIVAAPGLARVLDGLVSSRTSSAVSWSWPIASVIVSIVLAVGAGRGVSYGRLDPGHWPLSALPVLDRLPVESRLFHEQDWGGLVESECRPRRRAFIDDRFELFGRREIFRYLNAVQGGPDWETIRDEQSIGLVWLRPDRGLVRRIEADPSWRLRHRDAVSVLFEKTQPEDSRPDLAGR
jgi:hypothetical protein